MGHYQRSLEVSERLLLANPESAQAARDVAISHERLGDFAAERGESADAIAHYRESLTQWSALHDANPESSDIARGLIVPLERMARITGLQPDGEAAQHALEFQLRALEIAMRLREGNPQSVFYARTVAVSFFLTFQRAQAVGNRELVVRCLTGCFSVLDPLVQAGAELDEPMRQLHAQLAPMFSRPQ
jgi:tetratricopeptide (TPR) repeat protein